MHLTKSEGLRSWKALDFKKWGSSSLGVLQKFTPMGVLTVRSCFTADTFDDAATLTFGPFILNVNSVSHVT